MIRITAITNKEKGCTKAHPFFSCPKCVKEVYCKVMLCWRGLGATHIHRLFTTYILYAKVVLFLYRPHLKSIFFRKFATSNERNNTYGKKEW